MKILEVRALALPDVKLIRFARFPDPRGFFTETFRLSDFESHPELACFRGVEFVQHNESRSRAGVIRGLHFQWSPPQGKLVRTLNGRMVDLVLDIRKGSPTAGKIIACDMPAQADADYGEWIWVPPGFAHGNLFPEPTQIAYLCSGSYNPACEGGISPLAEDLDWSLCEPHLKQLFDAIVAGGALLSEKDRAAPSFAGWMSGPQSNQFQVARVTWGD
ncbi:MAG: dTDP-4-dehydrorhamnose 3,5-epimerase family protein [Planctomycetota bacterium]